MKLAGSLSGLGRSLSAVTAPRLDTDKFEGERVMGLRTRLARSTLLVCVLLSLAVPVLGQGTYTEDRTYDMYYAKRAKGQQPVPFDVGEIDQVNLANGNVMLTLPLGPALHADADLAYQLQLYYNSKIWSRDERDERLDEDESGSWDFCWSHESKGLFVGDDYVGLGWTLKLPHVYLRRNQLYPDRSFYPPLFPECTNATTTPSGCELFYIDSVISEDGARHQLRRCSDRWEGCSSSSDPDPNVYYSADGGEWRVTWDDRDYDEAFSRGDRLIGEHGGLRYLFTYGVLLDPSPDVTHQDGIHKLVGSDFLNEARGWYCTRIESIRWSQGDVGFAYPAIVITYQTRTEDVSAPIPQKIQAVVAEGQGAGRIEFETAPSGSTIQYIRFWRGEDNYLSYELHTVMDQDGFHVLDYPFTQQQEPDCYCAASDPHVNCPDRPPRYTSPFHKLERLDTLDSNGASVLYWGFEYNDEDSPLADDNEKYGALKEVQLPNRLPDGSGSRIEYQYGEWDIAYQSLGVGRRFLCHDFFGVYGGPCDNSPGYPGERGGGQDPDITDVLVEDATAGIVDRKVIDVPRSPDPRERLLEWTQYLGRNVYGGPHDADTLLLNRWGIPIDFSNHPGGDEHNYELPALDPQLFFMGYNQTVLRRHLVADDAPPAGSADDLGTLGFAVDVPSARFDDTIYVYSNGRAIHSVDDCVGKRLPDGTGTCSETDQTHRDHFGELPLDGRLLEVRSYRGSAENSPGEFTWFGDSPKPVRVEQYTYTLDPEDGLSLQFERYRDYEGHPPVAFYTLDSDSPNCRGTVPFQASWGIHRVLGEDGTVDDDDLFTFCPADAESVRVRRVVTKDIYQVSPEENASYYSGSESWYETDTAIPDDDLAVGDYQFQWNRVLTRSLSDFLDTDTWPAQPPWDISSTVTYDESLVSSWLTTLPSQETTTLSTDFTRTTYSYYSQGAVESKTNHRLFEANDPNNDVTTSHTYWGLGYQSVAGLNYGQVRTVELEKNGLVDDATGYEYQYDYQYNIVNKTWKLCHRQSAPRGQLTVDLCPEWQVNPTFSVQAELVSQRGIDSRWRHPTWVKDGNGDGLAQIDYDVLERVTHLAPTDPAKADTWVYYPDFRTSEVFVEDVRTINPFDPSRPEGTLIRRYEFDGLGRVRHSASLLEGLPGSTNTFIDSWHRYTATLYDGAGTAWAQSHSIAQTEPVAPANGFSSDPDWELVARVDPFGRVEKSVASDGGQSFGLFQGRARTLAVVASATGVPLVRTLTSTDARGNTLAVWEDKDVPAILGNETTEGSALYFPSNLLDRDSFIETQHAYDVANRMTSVTVSGCAEPAAPGFDCTVYTQTRTFDYNALGELEYVTQPETGTVAYQYFNARGVPRRAVYPGGGGVVDTYQDAAGRFVERWVQYPTGDDWYKVAAAKYGTSAAAHNIGKPELETRYNIVAATPEPCPVGVDGCVEASSIGVKHAYTYLDSQGLLDTRTTTVSFGGDTPDGPSPAFTMGYSYDLWANIAGIEYPSLDGGMTGCSSVPTITIAWDAVSLQGATDDLGTSLLLSPAYDGNTGMMTQWSTPAGYHDSYVDLVNTYVDVDGTRARPASIRAERSPYSFFDSGLYTYDVLGNVTGIGTTWAYSYDTLNRLTQVTAGQSAPKAFLYDDFGNLTEKEGSTIAVNHSTNRLSGAGYVYDSRGNLTDDPQGSWTRHLAFDFENRLTAAWASGTGAPAYEALFAYDLAGERVLAYRLMSGQVTEATFSIRDEGGNVLTDVGWTPSEGAWIPRWDHFYLGRQPVVHIGDAADTRTYTSVVADHLDSTRAEVFNAGTGERTTVDYWPYGETTQQLGLQNLIGKHLFTAHEREYTGGVEDVMQGLDYMHARYYSYNLGRFVSIDSQSPSRPGGSQHWNRYSYALNNPAGMIDPSGLAAKSIWRRIVDWLAGRASWDDEEDEDGNDEVEHQAYLDPEVSGIEGQSRKQRTEKAENEVREFEATLVEQGTYAVAVPVAGKVVKAVNLPAWKRVVVDMEHIASGHMVGGARVSAAKTLFPEAMSAAQVETAVRTAYRFGSRVKTVGERALVRGEAAGLRIEMWVNTATKTIESAYPF